MRALDEAQLVSDALTDIVQLYPSRKDFSLADGGDEAFARACKRWREAQACLESALEYCLDIADKHNQMEEEESGEQS